MVKPEIQSLFYIVYPKGRDRTNSLLNLHKDLLNDIKDHESIQSSTTPDPGYHMGK